MKILEMVEVLELLSKLSGKWIVQLSGLDGWYDGTTGQHGWSLDAVLQAAPFINVDDNAQAIADGVCVLLFNTEEEASRLFESLPSDDNPPSDSGGIRFHLLLFDPTDGLVNEST